MGLNMINRTFWQGKKVFITGHTGFKGCWLSLWLESMGAEVKGYSISLPTSPCLFEEISLEQTMNSEVGDIRDFSKLKNSIDSFKPEIVFHLAAQSLVRFSYSNPIETYSTNVMGTVNLLEAIRLSGGVKAVINVTSDKCYENKEWLWGYRENEAMGGYDPYSNSKGCAELVTSSFRSSFFNIENYHEHGVAIASVRAGNVIGGGDWAADRLVPEILEAVMNNREIKIRNPNAIRPWQHVLEPLGGYLILAEKLYSLGPDYSEAWNFGPSDEDAVSVAWIARKLTELWGNNTLWDICEAEHPHEANYLKLDCSKARARLGWCPVWDTSEALARIVEWYKAWISSQDIRAYTLDEINEYTNIIQGLENVSRTN